jgi:hypothetical protein
METLEKLFGGAARVKIMRLFLFNPSATFSTAEITERSKVDSSKVQKETAYLKSFGMVRKTTKSNGRSSWHLNEKFPYLVELQRLLIQTSLVNQSSIIRKLSKLGRLRVVVLAGLFKEQWEGRLDMLVVADGIKKGKVDALMKLMEAEIGKEIRYAVLDTADFKYRLGIGDKLVRDIVDYPHDVIFDKLGVMSAL